MNTNLQDDSFPLEFGMFEIEDNANTQFGDSHIIAQP